MCDGSLQSSLSNSLACFCVPLIQSKPAVIRFYASSINIFSSFPLRNLNLSSGTTVFWLCHKIRTVGNECKSQDKQPNGNNKQASAVFSLKQSSAPQEPPHTSIDRRSVDRAAANQLGPHLHARRRDQSQWIKWVRYLWPTGNGAADNQHSSRV